LSTTTEKLFELAAEHFDAGRFTESAGLCDYLVQQHPDDPDAWFILGLARLRLNRPPESSAEAFERASKLDPDNPLILCEYAGALLSAGRILPAIPAIRKFLQFDPGKPTHWSTLLYLLNFLPDDDPIAIRDQHADWHRQYVQPQFGAIEPYPNDRAPDRRLKIGYVSPDFRNHCQSFFTLPLLSHHDHAAFEIFCYSSAAHPDDWTARLQKSADVWRSVSSETDEALARQIRHDGIDILIDLTMHMAGGRPMLFARKPAPIQVAWLAYPGTTGLPEIDYRLTDPHLDPPGERDSWYAEKSIRLPDTFWCYDPADDQTPVNPLPALTNGFITFGCLTNFNKVNDQTIALWASVLRKTPNSRLLLLTPREWQQQYILQRIGDLADRVDFVGLQPRDKYLRLFHRFDVGLDTFPYNGHTTTLDSLWMGVPVLTLFGKTAVSRAGLSLLSNLRLESQTVAATADEYLQLALNFSNNFTDLAQLRQTLRQRMQKSPLMDAPRFAKNIEAAYRQMWRHFCRNPSGT
jgi:predicted O-linked N-acetylglucosamine transferase (SPINDLY family)